MGLVAYATFERLEAPESQFFGPTFTHGPPSARVVALTYDDGPSPPDTDRVLDVLRADHVHATFFVVGRAVAAHPALVRRMVREGHAVGNHSWDHGHLIVLSRPALRADLERTQAAIVAATGTRTRLLRPPYGQRDFLVLDEARREGYRVVMWSVPLARDWERPGDAIIAERTLAHVEPGSIIVLHDGDAGGACVHDVPRACDRDQAAGATARIVTALHDRGYRFVTVPELLSMH